MKLFLPLLLPLLLAVAHPPVWSPVQAATQQSQIRLGERQAVTPISFNGKEFTNAFNSTADRPRLVLVFSPT